MTETRSWRFDDSDPESWRPYVEYSIDVIFKCTKKCLWHRHISVIKKHIPSFEVFLQQDQNILIQITFLSMYKG